MNVDITELINSSKDSIHINNNVSFDKELLEQAGIIEFRNVSIDGNIYVDSANIYHIDLDVDGIMVLPCSITLKPVDYKFICKIEEEYNETEISNMEKELNYKKSIDILPIIWENILLEIPLKVVSPDAYDSALEGDGWKLITDIDQEGEE